MSISDEAVEAAAVALYERDKSLIVPWGDTALPDRRAYMDEARAALEAAAPHMLADLAARLAGDDTGTYWDERRDHLTKGGTVRTDEQGDGYLCGIEHAADWILKQITP